MQLLTNKVNLPKRKYYGISEAAKLLKLDSADLIYYIKEGIIRYAIPTSDIKDKYLIKILVERYAKGF